MSLLNILDEHSIDFDIISKLVIKLSLIEKNKLIDFLLNEQNEYIHQKNNASCA